MVVQEGALELVLPVDEREAVRLERRVVLGRAAQLLALLHEAIEDPPDVRGVAGAHGRTVPPSHLSMRRGRHSRNETEVQPFAGPGLLPVPGTETCPDTPWLRAWHRDMAATDMAACLARGSRR